MPHQPSWGAKGVHGMVKNKAGDQSGLKDDYFVFRNFPVLLVSFNLCTGATTRLYMFFSCAEKFIF